MHYPYRLFFAFTFLSCSFLLLDCGQETPVVSGASGLDGEQLARIHCGSCHQYTPPERLDKATWREGVLPQMATRLGVSVENPVTRPMWEYQQMREAEVIPDQPLIDSVAWAKIRDFYLETAPDSLPASPERPAVSAGLKNFERRPVDLGLNGGALTTLLHWQADQQQFYVGDGRNQLFRVDGEGKVVDLYNFPSPPVAVHVDASGGAFVLSIGFIRPNNAPKGVLSYLSPEGTVRPLLDSLPRPVDMAFADLDQDGREDFVLCGFGHFTGRLSWFRRLGEQKFEEQILVRTPGALKTYVLDFNEDGLPDILTLMAQGDERILVHYNEGKGRFRQELLLRFDPVFGSSYFKPVDFDGDGDLDLLYVNGDNADYSFGLKPYHGIRLYENDGTNQFEEAWFFPLYGASKAQAADFDGDNDLDIAAIAFFPDFERHPEQGFVFLENKSVDENNHPRFSPATFKGAAKGRWLTLESGDFDGDGRRDIALGSFIYSPTPTPAELRRQWVDQQVNLLLLYNQKK